MAPYRFDHIHLLSRDPKATAQYYRRTFDAKIIESLQSDGKPRIELEMHGLPIFLLPVGMEENLPSSPPGPYVGLDHFAFLVSDLEETVAELKRRGAEFAMDPKTIRPGVKIAYVRAPENVRIELVERN